MSETWHEVDPQSLTFPAYMKVDYVRVVRHMIPNSEFIVSLSHSTSEKIRST